MFHSYTPNTPKNVRKSKVYMNKGLYGKSCPINFIQLARASDIYELFSYSQFIYLVIINPF